MTISGTADIIKSYLAEYEPCEHIAKSGEVYISVLGVLIRVSDHKRKVRTLVDFDIRTDWTKLIRRPTYSSDSCRVYLKEIMQKVLDKR